VNVVEGWATVVIGYEVVKTVVLVVKCPEEKAEDVEGLRIGRKMSIWPGLCAPPPPEAVELDSEDNPPPLLEEGYCVSGNVDPPLVIHHSSSGLGCLGHCVIVGSMRSRSSIARIQTEI
jgi:hypothetical protein